MPDRDQHEARMHLLCMLTVAVTAAWAATASAQRMPTPWKDRAAEPQEEVRGALSPAIGSEQAPVTIVNFSDYQCPFCRQLSGNLKRLLADYPGQVRIVYRHFAMTPESRAMAQAALCAADQGRFAEYHELVFTTPRLTPAALPELAERLGLEGISFRECLASERHTARIDADIREGERLDIQMTPTLFINGVRIAGAASPEKLRARVTDSLARARSTR